MALTNLIGSMAGVFTTIAFIPQATKTWKTRSAGDISLLMFLLFSGGVLLWFIYGILLHAIPIIIDNGVTLSLSASILALKLKDMRQQRQKHIEEKDNSL